MCIRDRLKMLHRNPMLAALVIEYERKFDKKANKREYKKRVELVRVRAKAKAKAQPAPPAGDNSDVSDSDESDSY
eukprot:548462-Pyramimonas_sp.AAC.1